MKEYKLNESKDEILEKIINNGNYNNIEKGIRICYRMQNLYGIDTYIFMRNPMLIIDKFDRTLWKQAFEECHKVVGKAGYMEDELQHSFALIKNDGCVFNVHSFNYPRRISKEEYKESIRNFLDSRRKYIHVKFSFIPFITEPNQEVNRNDVFVNSLFYRRIYNE